MTAAHRAIIGDGATSEAAAAVDSLQAQRILLISGSRSYRRSGAEDRLVSALQHHDVVHVEAVGRLPTLPLLLDLYARSVELGPFDIVLGVGGGRVLDSAKLLAALLASPANVDAIQIGRSLSDDALPVVAIPTTAGSGSESTHFAVLYVEGAKRSIAHSSLRPRIAIVDPELTHSLDPETTASTGLDALCQAIESIWSVRATSSSRQDAYGALDLAWRFLEPATNAPTADSRRAMAKAAQLAGRAIDVSYTTAPHALSYAITHDFGVPHGHAVALTFGPILLYNSQVTDSDVQHPAGARRVRQIIDEVCAALGCSNPAAAAHEFSHLIKTVGLPTRLRDVGITSPDQRKLIAGAVDSTRLSNNPRRLTQETIRVILESVL